MSRGVRDLRELICVSRLTFRSSDDEGDNFLSDEEGRLSRALSQLSCNSSAESESRQNSAASTRAGSAENRSPDSGVGTNGQSPETEGVASANVEKGDASKDDIKPHPPTSTKRSGASRRKNKKNKILDTLPTMHELPKARPLPPVKYDAFNPKSRSSTLTSSEDEVSEPVPPKSSSRNIGPYGNESKSSAQSNRRGNFDDLLTYIDATLISEWLLQSNEQVTDLTIWIHKGENFVKFAHFWLIDFPDVQKQDIFRLEYSIILDQLGFVFAAGRDAGKVRHRDLVQFLEGVFWEYPNKLLSSKGPFMFLDYLDVLTSERQVQYKKLLSDVCCSTRVKQYAQWTLGVRAFTLVSIWLAVVNFYRKLLPHSSLGDSLPFSTISKEDPSMERMYHAIRLGHSDVVHYMLASGKVRARSQDKHGRTLVFTAVMHNQPEILEFLLKKVKPSPNLNLPADTGNTPLHAAANNGEVVLVTTLLKAKGIQVNATNPQCEGATPLHLAVMHGHRHVVEVLLVAGADRHAKMGDLSVVEMARDFGHDDIYSLVTS